MENSYDAIKRVCESMTKAKNEMREYVLPKFNDINTNVELSSNSLEVISLCQDIQNIARQLMSGRNIATIEEADNLLAEYQSKLSRLNHITK